MKTNKSIAKRFKRTSSGKLKRAQSFKNHILTKKSSKRKSRLSKSVYLSGATFSKMDKILR